MYLSTDHLVYLKRCLIIATTGYSNLCSTPLARPYGFLEAFDPDFTPNASDLGGKRYTFRNQPSVCQWNLAQLATSLVISGLVEKV